MTPPAPARRGSRTTTAVSPDRRRARRVDVVAPTGVVGERGPQALALLARRGAGVHGTRAVGQLDGGVRRRLEVQPPGGLGFAPAVHGQGDEVRAVLVVPDDRDPCLARAPPDGVQAHEAEPLASLGPLEAEPPPAEPVRRAVQRPEGPDQEARRGPQLLLPLGGHAAPALAAIATDGATASSRSVAPVARRWRPRRSAPFRLKPLNVIHRPTASSQMKNGAPAIPWNVLPCSERPSMVAMTKAIVTGAPMRPSAGMARGTSRRTIQEGAEHQGVERRHEDGPEQERPVADGDERPPDDHRSAGVGGRDAFLAQGHEPEQAHDADGDDRGLQHPGHDEAEGEALVLTLDDREDGDRRADGRERIDHVEDGAEADLRRRRQCR